MKCWNLYYKNQETFSFLANGLQKKIESIKYTALLIQVFCGVNEENYIQELAKEITDFFPDAYIIGITTSGGIMNGNVSGLETVISITMFEKTILEMCVVHEKMKNPLMSGPEIVHSVVKENSKILLLFGVGEDISPRDILLSISEKYPLLLVAGGSAGRNDKLEPAFAFAGKEIIKNGYVAIALNSLLLEVHLYGHLGWTPIGKEFTITKAEGNRVYTINGIPTYQFYRRYLGIDKTQDFFNVIEFPLLLTRDDILIARTPLKYYEDDSLGFAGDFRNGEKVRLSFGDIELISDMIHQLCMEVRKRLVETIFVYSCESRRGFLQDLSDIETRPLWKIAPTAGFFTAGEYFHLKGKNHLLNSTMTVLTMSESPQLLAGNTEDPLYVCPIDKPNETEKISISKNSDNIAVRRQSVLKTLAHLFSVVNEELEKSNHNLSYSSLHDSLTGLYNRAFLDFEMKRLDEIETEIGLLICDMDFLKIINDSLGHKMGDKMICLLANVLQRIFSSDDVIARFGGDEFVVLSTGDSAKEFFSKIERLIQSVEQMRNESMQNILYISVGTAYRERGGSESLTELFSAADREMYQYKLENKEYLRKNIEMHLSKMKCAIIDTRC